MNAIAATVRGTIAMVAADSADPTSPAEMEAMSDLLPADEFPHLHESVMCPTDFLETDFEYGVRALARGLVSSVEQ